MEDLIEEHIASYREGDRTIFFVDDSPGEDSLEYFQNSSRFVILDCKNLQTKRMVNQRSVQPILEEARNRIVYATKFGKTLVLRMGDCVADFVTAMCDENCIDLERSNPFPPYQVWMTLPRGFMLNNGQLIRDNAEAFLRREDLREIRDGDCVALHPNFKLVISTSLPPDRVEELFFSGRYGLPGSPADFNFVMLS